ncbi:MAG TPA: hypothetical protein PK073_04960 [Ignavibacteriaceae bacterium]|jgi:hypothetical protein|nr:MAG: hypothetical protein B6D44_07505 [Ignavibacteriales bacterium UTCHB2]HQF42245.1 hypothetical protein [Ignavibacteriaceae bacterium]HQI40169.1 hypothetical protein [Ignavibacteriaceae bacterium]
MVTLRNFSILVFLLLINCFLFSQSTPPKETSKVSFIVFANNAEYSNLENELINKLKSSLEKNNLFSSDDFQIELLIGIKEIDDMNKAAISVTELKALPKETIEFGKNAQIFYSKMNEADKNNINEDSRFIREYVSEEYLKQFRSVWSNHLEIIEISGLDNFIQNLVAKYL